MAHDPLAKRRRISLSLFRIFDQELVKESMEDRGDDDRHYDQEDDAAIECVAAGKKLSLICL